MIKNMEKKIYAPDELLAFIAIHPGEMLMDELDARGISVDQFADIIKCDRGDFRKIVDCKSPITAEIAYKIEAATGIEGRMWVDLQRDYDIQTAKKDKKLARVLKQIHSAAASVLL